MSTKDLKGLVRHFYAELNKAAAQGRAKEFIMTEYDKMFATNVVLHSATGEDLHGLKELKKRASEHSGARAPWAPIDLSVKHPFARDTTCVLKAP
jgi:hypothetical protein